jgi:protein-L-isoaspartate(D-aspartate) O-methyltransferase
MITPAESRAGLALMRQVQARGIHDARVLEAVSQIPRSRFVAEEHRVHAGEDRPLPIGHEQTISQPYMVALMTQELDLRGGERVLEIGTGSGYQTAILARLAGRVYSVERHRLLSLRARAILDGLEITNVHYRIGDGTEGWAAEAPFDRILVTAAARAFPEDLYRQLVEGGRMVVPIGDCEGQNLTTIVRFKGHPIIHEGIACRFVPLVGLTDWSFPAGQPGE